jgi:hypothetical protein
MTYDPDLYGPPEYEPPEPDADDIAQLFSAAVAEIYHAAAVVAVAETLAELYAQAAADLDDQEATDE